LAWVGQVGGRSDYMQASRDSDCLRVTSGTDLQGGSRSRDPSRGQYEVRIGRGNNKCSTRQPSGRVRAGPAVTCPATLFGRVWNTFVPSGHCQLCFGAAHHIFWSNSTVWMYCISTIKFCQITSSEWMLKMGARAGRSSPAQDTRHIPTGLV
jgi:hypothetical protein